ncbi:MAG: TrkH family potassium uptake protein [Lachnospiraceae bacterium]|nr:TrkH family potassium uptake protein [Lachnospiraceae bacterium]
MNIKMIRYILSVILRLEAAFLLLPALTGLIYREREWTAYFGAAVLCLAAGFLMSRKKPEDTTFFTKEGFVIVSLSWIIMSVFGALPFVFSRDIPDYTDALFEMISGFTTTGASVLDNIDLVSHGGRMWRSFSHWIGGMGVIVFMLAILPSSGANMRLMRAESPGPSVGKLVPKVKQTAGILYQIYIVLTVAEMLLLLVSGMPLFDAVTISFGTAGTGGFSARASGFAEYTTLQQGIVTVFMILFGVNFNAYYLLLVRKWRDALQIEEIRWYFGIIAASIVTIAINIRHMYPTAFLSFHHAAFQVGAIITTTGFATADFNLWPELSKTILVTLMFIGACAGSTGGGLKVARMIILVKSVRLDLFRAIHPRGVKTLKMDGKSLDEETVRGVSAYFVTYIVLFILSNLILSFNGLDPVTNFTAVTANFNNIGPGLSLVGPMGNFGMMPWYAKYTLMFDMLAGRLELYPMMMLFIPAIWRKR